ncbi:MAG: 3-isopropylmalate dehydrogenase [Saprospiraceae bacterium]|nr:3-isopropylmalate dehydrogenase [Saprospiraceae bacterium]
MKKRIVVLPGDGIGPEVTYWARTALEAIGKGFNHPFLFEQSLIGHAAIEATGSPLPEETLDNCKAADAILLGAVGHPKYDLDPSAKVRPEQGLLKLRKSLNLFANLRPIKIYDALASASSLKREILEGTDILFYRELTGGIYFGNRGTHPEGNHAYDTLSYTREEIIRIATMAFQAAQGRRGILHSVDKANVLDSSRLWRATVIEVSKQFPDVQLVHMFVDNAAMQLIRDPKQFDVVLTGNMFGDILTDEASQISGSLGMLPSASLSGRIGMYEPVHGSAPDIAGKNMANPMATMLSAAMMLRHSFEMEEESLLIEESIAGVLEEGLRTRDIANEKTPIENICTTDEIGTQILEKIESRMFQSVMI